MVQVRLESSKFLEALEARAEALELLEAYKRAQSIAPDFKSKIVESIQHVADQLKKLNFVIDHAVVFIGPAANKED